MLNGVEFRTRHNDYSLYKPSTTSSDYHAGERIPYPDVPPAVTGTVEEQINEMREWFKAWLSGSTSPRDYRDYFKPLMCYMEGAWTSTSDGELEEPFESDRHFIDAKSWFDLQEKIRYTAYHGSKDNGENLAYLPTTIISINETTGAPSFAQFNYRIVCHPIEREVQLKWFRPAGDLHTRWDNILDKIMSEIPGKDNYGGSLTDNTFGLSTADVYTGQEADVVTDGGRNGGFTSSTAFNGIHSKTYYMTPSAFYGGGGEVNSDAADTLKAFIGVLDEDGNVRNVTASGIRIHLPAIP
ncbi:hypothetical protein ElyMa_004266900, partial [Elysia marginata]